MKSTMKYYLIVFFSIALFFACGDTEEQSEGDDGDSTTTTDVSVNIAAQLSGNWESTQVLRSGNKTDMGPFNLEFNSDDNIFTSNLFTTGGKLPYEAGVKATLQEHSLSFDNLTDTFYVDSIDEQNLVLSTTIQNFPFEFTFEKK